MTPDDRRRWEQTNENLAVSALRVLVLGLAWRELPESYSDADFDRELTFVGLVGMTDPLRDEAKAVIAACSLLPVAVVECIKLLQRFATHHPHAVRGTTN